MLETEKGLNKFGKHWRTEARKSLTRQGKRSTSSLYKSLDYNVVVNKPKAKGIPSSFELDLIMNDYGEFVDQGVKGFKSSSKAPNSPYKFGTGTGKKGGLTKGIDKWVTQNRIQFRNKVEGSKKKGQFLTKKATAFIIRRSVWNTGMKTTLFSTRPFELAFKRLPADITEAYALDVEDLLKFSLK